MSQNIKKEFEKNGFVRIRNVLDYKLDLEPIFNDMNFIMNRLVYRFVAKKEKKKISITVMGKNIPTKKDQVKFKALEEGTFFARDLVSEPGNILHPDEYAKRLKLLKK